MRSANVTVPLPRLWSGEQVPEPSRESRQLLGPLAYLLGRHINQHDRSTTDGCVQ